MGRKYELFTEILTTYKVHASKKVFFGIENFLKNFPEQDMTYLNELVNDGICLKRTNTIEVYPYKMIEVFLEELNLQFHTKEIGYTARLQNEYIVFAKDDDDSEIHFLINFNPLKPNTAEKTINFCNRFNVNFYLYWLDIVNDANILRMLSSYLSNEFESLAYNHLYSFKFLESLPVDVIIEIYNTSIKGYFRDKEHVQLQEPDFEDYQLVKKFLRVDNFEAFKVFIHSKALLIVRSNASISCLSVTMNKINYPKDIIIVLNTLHDKLYQKVSEYRKIKMISETNALRDTNNSFKLGLNIFTLLLTPANLIIFTIDVSEWLKITSIVLTTILVIFIVYLIIIPSIRPIRFSWKLDR
ncbi:hypothetical protein LCM20_14735 [Halobacillus litoralis]|uniref:hypothetical protein n=1 Tax=Halobacillus litoralis TaxID=45668 RepID=UPI001CD558B2|nr:hypothetical protein [Halobacillus litoralis]MCA0971860.1 hypothetical protein [Halobacillus litoralis]